MITCPEPVRLKTGVYVPCGKCGYCIQRKRNDYGFILKKELRYSTSASFITLTYNDENLPFSKMGVATLKFSDITPFLASLRKVNKRVRKNIRKSEKSSLWAYKREIKYFLVGEYGEKTQRPHYHGIFFNLRPHTKRELPDIWNKGHTHIGTVTDSSIMYCTDYLINRSQYSQMGDEDMFRTVPKLLVSKNLGTEYVQQTKQSHKQKLSGVTYDNGFKVRIPRNIKNKIYNIHEKELVKINQMQYFDSLAEKQKMSESKKMEALEYYNSKLLSKQKGKKL